MKRKIRDVCEIILHNDGGWKARKRFFFKSKISVSET